MEKKNYSFTYGHGVPANIVGKTLERIEERDGVVTAASFLEESRPEDSPTHGCFEWDDSVAAEMYRLQQSTQTILDLKVTVVNDGKPSKVHALVNVVDKAPGRQAEYKSIDVALRVEDERSVVIRNAIGEMKAFQKKYEELMELAAVFAEMDNAIEKLSA